MDLRIYEIYIPELGAYAKFKVLPPEEIKRFTDSLEEEDIEIHNYVKLIINNFVYNMQRDIIHALHKMSRDAANLTIEALFNGCIMLNPGLDIDGWVSLMYSSSPYAKDKTPYMDDETISTHPSRSKPKANKKLVESVKPKKMTKTKFINLASYLHSKVIGQDKAIDTVVNVLKRSHAGLNDAQRPLGVLLFAGSSGTGKTHLARELHNYLFGNDYDIVRIDCGEYQQKHENQKLMGSPPGYIGHEDGGVLTNRVLENPNTVVLLDEVEKAHPDLWDTFLRVFDEGMITDNKGNQVSFRNTIIIMTTNLGNEMIVDSLTGRGVGFNSRIQHSMRTKDLPARTMVERSANDSIKKKFKPEFLNRIDKIIIFNHLTFEDYKQIADLEMDIVDSKLVKKGLSLSYGEDVLEGLVIEGVDTIFGARGMARVRREEIEDLLADKILSSHLPRGTMIHLNYAEDIGFSLTVSKPKATNVSKA